MDAAEVPQVSPTLGGCHPLKTWGISPLESPKWGIPVTGGTSINFHLEGTMMNLDTAMFCLPNKWLSLFACLQIIIFVRTPQVLWIINVIMVCPWCIHTLWTLLYAKVPFAPEPLPNAGIGVSHPVVSWVYRLAKEWYTCMQMSGVANNIK